VNGQLSTPGDATSIQLSVVMPCLNEESTLAACIEEARQAMTSASIRGEIIVADNGSTDRSRELAEAHGARLLRVPQSPYPTRNGYGRGLRSGIAAARAPLVLMADSDASYDFAEIPKFYEKLQEGYDLVQGCRLPSGGGSVVPGAMPWLHYHLGNPFFSWLARRWFGVRIRDVNCGMRAFRKDWFDAMSFRTTGMEFAAEMILKAGAFRARVAEVPITLRPDGRQKRRPHLKTWRDGWRILRLLMLYSPTWLFMVPGIFLMVAGVVTGSLGMAGWQFNGVTLDVNTLLFSSVFILCGYQSVLYALLGKTYAMHVGLLPPPDGLMKIFKHTSLERGIIISLLLLTAGVAASLRAWHMWTQAGFGEMSYPEVMRVTIPSALLMVLGLQTFFMSFFISMLGLGRGGVDADL
jgi:glycosyltransferase involved in cell wall biosynthesis